MNLPVEIAHHMMLAPAATAGSRHLSARPVSRTHWWVAAAFLTSWVADSLSHFIDPVLVSATYGVSQAGLVGVALLDQRQSDLLLALLLIVGIASVGMTPPGQLDILLHTVALGASGGIAWLSARGWLRWSLVIGFGGAAIAWWWLVATRTYTAGYTYHAVRAIGVMAFCVAVVRE